MKTYDAIIIGGGGGLKLRPISNLGKKIAVIEKEDLGGTCLNRGCIPSKMLIHAADLAEEVKRMHKFNLQVDQNIQVEWEAMVNRVTQSVTKSSRSIADAYAKNENVDFYHGEAHFIEDKIVEVNGEQLTAERIFIAVGTRPSIPPIPGLEGTPFMTSREALRNTTQPKRMIVIGGGYIGVELGHFYRALGTETHFLVRSQVLGHEDREIADEFVRAFDDGNLHLGWSPMQVEYKNETFKVTAQNKEGETMTLEADALFVATGIRPNTDSLKLENTSIKTNEKGYIQVDDHLQTNVPGVYALGDCIGRYFFRHSVNFEGEYLLRTLYENPSDEPINYPPMPHAVFSNPQIAGVGQTEEELKASGADYFVGKNSYQDSAMGGDALQSEYGFCKLLFEKGSHKLLGAHIVGHEASTMIHQLIQAITLEATLEDLLNMIYIHPALPEIVKNAARKAKA